MTYRVENSPLGKELEMAIMEAVKEAGQSDSLAKRLIAWLSGLSEGSTSLEKISDIRPQFENLCAAIPIREQNDAD